MQRARQKDESLLAAQKHLERITVYGSTKLAACSPLGKAVLEGHYLTTQAFLLLAEKYFSCTRV